MATLFTKEWKLENVDTVLFDKDGTFVDLHAYWGRVVERRILAVIKKYALPLEIFDELALFMGYDKSKNKVIPKSMIVVLSRNEIIEKFTQKLIEIGVSTTENEIDDIFEEEHKEFLKEMYDYIKPIKDAYVFFEKLKKAGVKMAVVTSDGHNNAEKTLDFLEISHYFNLVIGKEDSTLPKKTGEPAVIALEKLGSDKENTISVGDAPMDSQMADKAGLKGSILVTTGHMTKEELKEYSKYVTTSLADISVC